MLQSRRALVVAIPGNHGRGGGSFRSDLPVGWLVTTCIAVIHACAGEVRAGRVDERDAVRILTATILGLFTGPGQEPGGNA
jgi:TetR/AcrR family transcriptional regulator, mexCD-oprJ operon repressor